MLLLVGVSVGIAGVAMAALWERFDGFVGFFFQELSLQEQVALLALLFALMLAWMGILMNVTGTTTDSSSGSKGNEQQHRQQSKKKKSIAYPFHDMNQALSDRNKFACLYPWLRDSILTVMKQDNELADRHVQDYLTRMMDYTIQGGKYNRGTTVVATYRAILKRALTPLEIAQAATLGWTIELLQAFFLVADDVMDESDSRRGQPCWYQVDDVQMAAINDAFLLESFLFTIVKQHFSHMTCYTQILELLLDVIQKTELGQLLDLQSQEPNKEGDDPLSHFTPERYRLIVRYKTAFYSFYLPIALAMSLAGITDEGSYRVAKEICGTMGEYFQVQDDVLDCYGDPRRGGEMGSDIQDKKCTWLIVQALQNASKEQKRILKENYGNANDEESTELVKQVYRDLALDKVF
ncbi:Farnesyl pyrophosphate synthase [Seminavis robusta]|uniref:Farnesyl pyrophosphate synthase n=1 Tax=Seminavis robusta TaxID=568900 RepID=A0A9N8E4P1_9STRA|nr:Farnesyl pyrophosphate synthase [Seminavis robusta]|eukprot:Sro616_g175930.1 Farnesyl pyrophosphate synthase (408) ;mRNA; f:16364-17587